MFLMAGLIAFLILAYSIGQASVDEVPDRGKLHLANATAFLDGKPLSVTQRPPLYGLLLAGLARLEGVRVEPQANDAREYGNIESFPVAIDLYSAGFLRSVLWLQLLLLLAVAWMVVITIKASGVSPGWSLLGLLIFAAIAPEYRVDILFDSVFTSLLVAVTVYASVAWVGGRVGMAGLVAAGVSASLAALSHAVFQLLGPFLIVWLYLWVRDAAGRRKVQQLAVSILISFLLLVGSVSAYNRSRHGFFGLSSALGSGLGTKTWSFVERAAPYYPEAGARFVDMRDQLLLKYYEHTGVYWGRSACEWLMQERGMNYVAANKYLLQFNLTAIRRANDQYLAEVVKSLVLFFFPAYPPGPALLRFAYFAVKLALFGIFAVTCVYMIVFRSLFGNRDPARGNSIRDLTLITAVGTFLYGATIICACDMGKPGQRASVLFLLAIVVPLGLEMWWKERKERQSRTTTSLAG
jgi:hypothetical protein